MTDIPSQPIGGNPTGGPKAFFQEYLAAPIVIALFAFWKVFTRNKGGFFVRAHQMDLITGMRTLDLDPIEDAVAARKQSVFARVVHNVV